MSARFIEPPHPHRAIQLLDETLVVLRDLSAKSPDDIRLRAAREQVELARAELQRFAADASATE